MPSPAEGACPPAPGTLTLSAKTTHHRPRTLRAFRPLRRTMTTPRHRKGKALSGRWCSNYGGRHRREALEFCNVGGESLAAG